MKYQFKSFLGREPESIREFFNASATIFNDKILFHQETDDITVKYSYTQFKNDIDALGTELLSRNLGGKNIIVMGENCYEWALVYMTVVCGVGTIVPVDKNLSSEELAKVAEFCEAEALFCSDEYSDVTDALPSFTDVVLFSELGGLIENGAKSLADGDGRYLIAPINPDETAIIMMSKVNSDKPIGKMLSHRNVCAMLYRSSGLFDMNERDLLLSVLPMHYPHEMVCGFLAPIYFGASVVFGNGLSDLIADMNDHHPTIIVCTPLIAKAIYKRIRAIASEFEIEKRTALAAARLIGGSFELSVKKRVYEEIHERLGGRLKSLYLCGSAANEALCDGLKDYGINTIREYGLSAYGFIISVGRPTKHQKCATGIPLPNGVADIYNIKEDGTGEVRYKGDNVLLGYYKNPEKTVEAIHGGWFYTGDVGYIDERGILYVTGRKNNTITNAKGKKIVPEELEACLNKSPYIKECVVVGIINDSRKDFDLVAVVYPDKKAFAKNFGEGYTDAIVEKEIEAAVERANSIAHPYKHIKHFTVRNTAFDKNKVGKIKRSGVAASIASEHKRKISE